MNQMFERVGIKLERSSPSISPTQSNSPARVKMQEDSETDSIENLEREPEPDPFPGDENLNLKNEIPDLGPYNASFSILNPLYIDIPSISSVKPFERSLSSGIMASDQGDAHLLKLQEVSKRIFLP